jgi:hypothetical protein
MKKLLIFLSTCWVLLTACHKEVITVEPSGMRDLNRLHIQMTEKGQALDYAA